MFILKLPGKSKLSMASCLNIIGLQYVLQFIATCMYDEKFCFEMEEVVYIDKSSPLLRGLFRP